MLTATSHLLPQVIQFLLAKNYHLTALELLVESQQAGRVEEVAELHRFFSDPDKFPQEELSRHQNGNGKIWVLSSHQNGNGKILLGSSGRGASVP